MSNTPIDLRARARQAMIDAGFHPDFPPEVLNAVQRLKQNPLPEQGPRDLRDLPWSSIDNDTSRDLDQIEYAEKLEGNSARLLIGLADVDSAAAKDSPPDVHAASETTSVYTGAVIFPMLPPELSNNLTSLVEGQDRQAMVVELRVLESGDVAEHSVYPALVRNRAKLAYSSTGAWLEGRGPTPPPIAALPELADQLKFQLELSNRLRALRKKQGALTFGSIEPTAVMDNGQVKGLAFAGHTVAQDIIESFMVAANVAMARFLSEKGRCSIRRVVKTPKRWDRIQTLAKQFGTTLPAAPDSRALSEFLEQRRAADPDHFPDLSLAVVKLLGPGEYAVGTPGGASDGHFGLAVHDYTHSTAPNRRFADLVTQRLLKCAVVNTNSAYSEAELDQLAVHCTEREDAARKVERLMRKVIAANLLVSRIGEIFDAIVTGAAPKGTYVRLLKFPAEGRVVRGQQGIDVGDHVRVRLISLEVSKGFIDFELAPK